MNRALAASAASLRLVSPSTLPGLSWRGFKTSPHPLINKAIGIVGLPNIGKSTLFNALTKTEQAQAANYPFCTIEPNVAKVAVPDSRLDKLFEIQKSEKKLPTKIEFMDIAGLVKGASKGEGLGNQFLSNINNTSIVLHVVRCFEDHDILHVDGSVDPIRDIDTINTELILKDLDSLGKHIARLAKKRGDKAALKDLAVCEKLVKVLDQGKLALTYKCVDIDEERAVAALQLITSKKVLYVCHVNEDEAATGNDHSRAVAEYVGKDGSECVVVSAKLESESACFPDEASQVEFLQSYGLEETGLNKVIKKARLLLNIQDFYTIGPKEARAWTIPIGTKGPQAAAVIHSDFEKHFIRCETIAYKDFVKYGGEDEAKRNNAMRVEGKEYVLQDGDVVHFLTSA